MTNGNYLHSKPPKSGGLMHGLDVCPHHLPPPISFRDEVAMLGETTKRNAWAGYLQPVEIQPLLPPCLTELPLCLIVMISEMFANFEYPGSYFSHAKCSGNLPRPLLLLLSCQSGISQCSEQSDSSNIITGITPPYTFGNDILACLLQDCNSTATNWLNPRIAKGTGVPSNNYGTNETRSTSQSDR
jgi:hypothetical protein